MLRVSIRTFSRNVYGHIKLLPITVYNKRTGKDLFKVEKIDDNL